MSGCCTLVSISSSPVAASVVSQPCVITVPSIFYCLSVLGLLVRTHVVLARGSRQRQSGLRLQALLMSHRISNTHVLVCLS